MWTGIMVLLSIFLCEQLGGRAGASCVLGENHYDNGETFSPVMSGLVSSCVNCTCNEGKVQCDKVHCPPAKCREPKVLPNVCCPFCEDIDNLPPTVDKNEEGGDSGRRQGCESDGHTYADGEVFSSNSTGIRAQSTNQCVDCVCTNGNVFCILKTCNIPRNCRQLVNSTSSCCPTCADVDNSSLEATGSSLSGHDCLDTEGNLHSNGSSWHPALSKCVTCTCESGNVTCSKVQCRTDSSLPCRNPRHRGSDCCKSCAKRKKQKICINEIDSLPNRKNDKQKRKKKKKGNKKSRRRNRKGRSTEPVQILPPILENIDLEETRMPTFFDEMCIPKKHQYLLYEHLAGHFLFIALDNVRSSSVEVWRLRLKRPVCEEPNSPCERFNANIRIERAIERFIYPREEFRKQTVQNMIKGSLPKKNTKRLKRKLEAYFMKCSKQNRCKVRHVLKKLARIKRKSKISYNCNCSRH